MSAPSSIESNNPAESAQSVAMLALTSDLPLEKFRAPEGIQEAGQEGELRIAAASSIVGVSSHAFSFRENGSSGRPPGQTHEKSVVVQVPSGAGFFICLANFSGSYVQRDLTRLIERPLGQFMIDAGMRGNNLVCRVRLTDANQDDPIAVWATVIVVFYR